MIKYASIIKELPSTVPFVGPETQERNLKITFKARIGANESVFGPSPKAIAAMTKATRDTWMYGDPENYDLKLALANKHNISTKNIVVGEGIDGLLGYLCQLLIEPGVQVVTSMGAYPTFNYHVKGYGGILNFVPYKDDHEDVNALLNKAKLINASIIYVSNPDNPMGTFHSKEVIEDIVNNLPHGTLLCLDEAYSDFLNEEELPTISVDNPQVIRMRTFSKAYGMAGLRIGYAITNNELALSFDKVRNHFGVNKIAQLGALAALNDRRYLLGVLDEVESSKRSIAQIAKKCGLEILPSRTNFVAIDCGEGEKFSERVMNGLIEKKIFVRRPFVKPQNRCIRISAGRNRELSLLTRVLPEVLKYAKI